MEAGAATKACFVCEAIEDGDDQPAQPVEDVGGDVRLRKNEKKCKNYEKVKKLKSTCLRNISIRSIPLFCNHNY